MQLEQRLVAENSGGLKSYFLITFSKKCQISPLPISVLILLAKQKAVTPLIVTAFNRKIKI